LKWQDYSHTKELTLRVKSTLMPLRERDQTQIPYLTSNQSMSNCLKETNSTSLTKIIQSINIWSSSHRNLRQNNSTVALRTKLLQPELKKRRKKKALNNGREIMITLLIMTEITCSLMKFSLSIYSKYHRKWMNHSTKQFWCTQYCSENA
jgi:hypothetical protein